MLSKLIIYYFHEEDCRICPRCGIEHTKREGCIDEYA